MSRLGVPVPIVRACSRMVSKRVFNVKVPVPVARRRVERVLGSVPLGRGVTARPVTLGGVPCERIDVGPASRSLLYLHGGAYVLGSPRTHRAIVVDLARALGATAWIVDYRLAPEHPHPAAVDDVVAAYHGLLAEGTSPEQILVVGDSAGGGLTLALAATLRDAGDPLPAGLGLLCPWIDLAADLAGQRPVAPREPLLNAEMLAQSARYYTDGADPTSPRISPLYGDLRGLPPMVLSSAADDMLIGDSDALEQRAREQGARLVHQRHPGGWHTFQVYGSIMPRARRALDVFVAELRALAELSQRQ
jgi:acetyl esterase/lipase